MARVSASGFGSLGKAITDILAAGLHHAIVSALPHFHASTTERHASTLGQATEGAEEVLTPIFGPLHDQLDPTHPLHPIVGLLAGKRKQG